MNEVFASQVAECVFQEHATAVPNVLINESLVRKEKENALLLSFSHMMASVRNKEDLSIAIEKAVSSLSSITRYIIHILSEDQQKQRPYIYDTKVKETIEKKGCQFVLDAAYPVKDNVANVVLAGNKTLIYNLQEWIEKGKAPFYFNFWRSMGVDKCIAIPLRTGDRNLGIFCIDSDESNCQLLHGMCAQISIAMSNILANEELLRYRRQLEIENEHLQKPIRALYNASEIIGTGKPMQRIYHLMSLVAPSNATVLIGGETGTGKELIARGIHEASSRRGKVMVKVNCAALPASLIEAELFGHERGAFTGACERKIGKFELAQNGTIFLDEIGELPLELQVKLLRIIQEREFERIGGKTTIKVDVRIITATNLDLLSEVGAGRFRADLYYRLNVFPIVLPPLRERRADIPELARFFLAKYNSNHACRITGISIGAMQELTAYHWPGNVRELEHLIERSVLLFRHGILEKVFLPPVTTANNLCTEEKALSLADAEKQHIVNTIIACGGKIAGKGGAAQLLKIPASTLHSRMKKLGITKKLFID